MPEESNSTPARRAGRSPAMAMLDLALAPRHDEARADEGVKVEKPGDFVGRYELLGPLGEGGFGCVWRAQQTEPIRRELALKLIKPGMDSREIIARFEAERQALAMMDHPNIAAVLDAGTTTGGATLLCDGTREGRGHHRLLRQP